MLSKSKFLKLALLTVSISFSFQLNSYAQDEKIEENLNISTENENIKEDLSISNKDKKVEDDLTNLSLEELLNMNVVSASKQVEPLSETPVPVTVITSQMIKNIGAKTLKDVLITYVPSMTFSQDHNEMNVAMRGVYGSSQQKILIMLNGHRLNSRAYSSANPDYGINLENIKQIEVLRGPASSLYGNVALTGIINIITKQGKDVDGSVISAGIGNYGQNKLNYLYGKEFSENHDLLLWGSYYKADGQRISIKKENDFSDKPVDGYSIIDGMKDNPSYDIGLVYNFNEFSIFANKSYTKYIEPFSAGGVTGRTYEYDNYRTLFGEGPGLSSNSSRFGVTYKKDFGDLGFMFNAYNDYNDVHVVLVSNPLTQERSFVSFSDSALGFISQLSKPYDFGFIGNGNGIFGVQVERMDVYDSSMMSGENGEYTKFSDTKAKPVLEKGNESVYSVFGQVKHRITDEFILNAGLRYDEKQKHTGNNVRDLSPRLALIYLPSDLFQMKLSYSQSFVDPPYWYRYNTLPSYTGSTGLLPEHLRSIQLSETTKLFENRFNNTLTLFYNDLYDFIYRDPKAPKEGPTYKNAGSLKSIGLEEELAFIQDFYSIRGIFTYQRALSAKDYPVTNGEINNIPAFTGNLVFDINPIFWIYDKCSLNLTAKYISSQASPIKNNFLGGEVYDAPNNRVDQALLFNLGFNITEPWLDKVSFDARVYNLFDTKYQQGGSVAHPYLQSGRWFLLNASYKF